MITIKSSFDYNKGQALNPIKDLTKDMIKGTLKEDNNLDIELNIKFINMNDQEEVLTLTYPKQKLIDNSKYFQSIFSFRYKETDKKELCFDFTNNPYQCPKEYIKDLFEYALNGERGSLFANSMKILICDSNKENSYHIDYNLNYGILARIPIWDYLMVIPYLQYFMFDSIREEFYSACDFYLKLLEKIYDNMNKINYNMSKIEDKMEEEISENFVKDEVIEPDILDDLPEKELSGKKTFMNIVLKDAIKYEIEFLIQNLHTLDSKKLSSDLQRILNVTVINDLIKNIYGLYLSYKFSEKGDAFKELLQIIKYHMEVYNEEAGLQYFPKISTNNTIPTENLMKYIPLQDHIELLTLVEGIINIKNQFFNPFEFRDILYFQKSDWPTYKIKNLKGDQELPMKKEELLDDISIKTEEEFKERFAKETREVFNNIDWKNMILSGGFLFGLLNNINNSLLESSDIDLFIFGNSKEVIIEKVHYLIDYFLVYEPYIVKNGSVINIIIPALKYDIQIIICNKRNPADVIDFFDLSYLESYFDGEKVYCTMMALLGFKYQITTIRKDRHIKGTRLYKTALKGISIVSNPEFRNNLIEDRIIDFKSISENSRFYIQMNKSVLIRKCMKVFDEKEVIHLVNYYYKAEKVIHKTKNDPATDLNIELSSFNSYIFNQRKLKFDTLTFRKGIKRDNKWRKIWIFDQSGKNLKYLYFELENRRVFQVSKAKEINFIITPDRNTFEKIQQLQNRLVKQFQDIDGELITVKAFKEIYKSSYRYLYNDYGFVDEETGESVKEDLYLNNLGIKISVKERHKLFREVHNKLNDINLVNIIIKAEIWRKDCNLVIIYTLDEIDYIKK